MPIAITRPIAGAKIGNAITPNILQRRFVAHGTKEADQAPLGVLLSVRPDGTVDGRYRIGGRTLSPPAGSTYPNTRWVIAFDLPPQIRRRDLFTLVVFDSKTLPGDQAAATTYTKQWLAFDTPHARPRSFTAAGGGGGVTLHGYTVTSYSTDRSEFVAFGTLPEGSYDVNTSESKLVDENNAANFVRPSWAWVDDYGFWVALFDPFSANAVPAPATLTMVYHPYGVEENATGIALVGG